MNGYENKSLGEILKNNSYPGRGIVCGKSGDGTKAVTAYFITGRSENSRNRVFAAEGENVTIYPFDHSRAGDLSLIIYSPIKRWENKLIVTNGEHTDTIYSFLRGGKSMEEALKTRSFEPDAPHFTPRISAVMTLEEPLSYQMSILKSMDAEGNRCARCFYDYEAETGTGHFIHTYREDANPLPAFCGEPLRIKISGNIDDFTNEIWTNLNEENKISLFVRFTDLTDGKKKDRIINKQSLFCRGRK